MNYLVEMSDKKDGSYWGKEFDSGKMSIQNIRDSIKQSTEFKNKQLTSNAAIANYQASRNPVSSPTLQLTSPSYTPTPTATPAPSRSIANPYATDPNYTTTAPTSGDPQQQFKAGGNTYYRTGSDNQPVF